jgi:hypothetical protein
MRYRAIVCGRIHDRYEKYFVGADIPDVDSTASVDIMTSEFDMNIITHKSNKGTEAATTSAQIHQDNAAIMMMEATLHSMSKTQ